MMKFRSPSRSMLSRTKESPEYNVLIAAIRISSSLWFACVPCTTALRMELEVCDKCSGSCFVRLKAILGFHTTVSHMNSIAL